MLRKLEEKDIDGMLEWMHDESLNRWFKNRFSEMNYGQVADFVKNSFNSENQNWAITDENDRYMGTISLKNISVSDRNAEYAIITRKCAHGTGLAYKATKEVIRYAFDELKLHRVYLNVLEENGRANNFYRKCGFQFEGTSVGHIYIPGKGFCNLNWYAVINDGRI